MPKRIYKRKVSKAPYKKRAMRRSTVSKNVKKYVKSAIHRQIENKSFFVTQAYNFGSAVESPDLNLYPILWAPSYHTISRGVLDGQFVGNKLTLRRVTLRYTLHSLPQDILTNPNPLPTMVQMFLLRNKQDKSGLVTNLTKIWNSGASSFGLAGSLVDLNNELNPEFFDKSNCKVWTHKQGFAGYSGSGSVAAQQYFQSNDFSLINTRTMDLTKYFPKVVRFDDSNQINTPQLSFGFQAIAANGGITGATILNTSIRYSITIEYEDC